MLLMVGLVSSSAFAGGNAAVADACQHDGWTLLARSEDGTTFTDPGECVSYGAHGGRAVAFVDCFIVDTSGGASYPSLQAANDAATAGDTLTIKGRCVGTTVIDRNLTLLGEPSPGYSAPTLDGNGGGSVVDVTGSAVAMSGLTITNGVHSGVLIGSAPPRSASLVLQDCTVTGNTGESGGGILSDGGTVVLTASIVSNNSATDTGGGIWINGGLTLRDGSRISGNTAAEGGGIFNSLGGAVTLNDVSTISSNSATFGAGGGIYNNRGRVTLNDSSSVTGNFASASGGGIYNNLGLGTVTLNGNSSVTNNTPNDIFP
jgi:nitrous oxidase accessory protein NosD